jgi:hypothetical protein
MKKQTAKLTRLFISLLLLGMVFLPSAQVLAMPVTGDVVTAVTPALVDRLSISLDDFAASVKNGNSGQIVGLYADDVFALSVVQQPSGNTGYVSTSGYNVATQFGMASSYGSIGMLAHNYLAGSYFSNLASGSEIVVIYGDGSTVSYTVSEVRKYQALTPSSAYSNFINLSDPSETLTSSDVFSETYGTSGALVLQTCISKDGNSSWGRLFVIAIKS